MNPRLPPELVTQRLKAAGLEVVWHGLNADWSFPAWLIGTGPPMMRVGEHYLIDTEDHGYAVVVLTEPAADCPLETGWWFTPIIDSATLEMAIIEARHLLSQVAKVGE